MPWTGRKIRLLIVATVVILLVATALLAFSCGKKDSETETVEDSASVEDSGAAPAPEAIDETIEEMDEAVDSVDPEEDFSDSKLDNNELGL